MSPSRFPLAVNTWGPEENDAIRAVLDSGRITMGERVRTFEGAFADRFGSRHAVFVNSGSSANLLLVAALAMRGERPLQRGDQVIVPAVSWATTYYPWAQYGVELRFVDVDPATFNLDADQVERAITDRTRAVMAVNLLGAPCDFTHLSSLCAAHDLVLVEDNCESMGATVDGRETGTFGAMGSFSTFFSHHISTGEGGVVVTDDDELRDLLVSLRAHGWTRDLGDSNHVIAKTDDPFYESFRFVLPGYNLRPTEFAAAAGIEQLKKFDGFLAGRRANAERFVPLFADLPGARAQQHGSGSSWFGFAFVLDDPSRRGAVVTALRENGVEVRPIVAGNFLENPVIERLPHSAVGDMPVARALHAGGFFVGNHHFPIGEELGFLRELLGDLLA